MPTGVLSLESRRIVLRCFRDREVSDEFLASFSDKVAKFANDISVTYKPHNRGNFAYFNFGFQHGSGNGEKVGSELMPLLSI